MLTRWAGRAGRKEQKGAGEVVALLPFELLVAIFSHVDTVQDISHCRLVCSRWAAAGLDSSLRYHSGWIRLKEEALFQEGKFKLRKEKTRFFNLAQGSAELFFTKAGIRKNPCLTSWQLLKDDEVEPEDGVLWDEPVPGSGSPTSPNAEKPDYEPKTKTEAEERALPFVRRERMVARMEGGYYCTFVHWKNEHVVGLFGGYAMFLDEQTLKVKKEWPRKHWCEPSVIVAEDNLFGIKTLYGGDHCKFSYSSTQSSNCPSNIRKVRYTDGSP